MCLVGGGGIQPAIGSVHKPVPDMMSQPVQIGVQACRKREGIIFFKDGEGGGLLVRAHTAAGVLRSGGMQYSSAEIVGSRLSWKCACMY